MKISESLEQKLKNTFNPVYLKVINESQQHNVPEDSETHFKVIIVASEFSGLSLVKRHQRIYSLVNEEMENGLHALSLHTFSPEEWEKKQHQPEPETPACRGGLAQQVRVSEKNSHHES